jgi:hypothetical protein
MMELSDKKSLSLVFSVMAVLIFIPVVNGQTALRQLESWAGRSINSYSVSAPSAPSSSSGSGTYQNPFVKTFEQKQDEARDHYQKALKDFNSRNWEDAIRLLNKAIRKDPYTQYYKDKLREAEMALAKEKQQNKEYQDRIKQQEEARRKLEEEKRRIEEARLEKERKEQEAIKEKIKVAKETIIAFKKDIKYAQGHLKNFTKSLTNNTADLEKWGKEVDDAYNRVLEDSKLTPAQVKNIMMKPARDVTTGNCSGTALNPGGIASVVGPDASTGNGLVDAHKAVLSAKVQCLGPIKPITVQPITGPIKPITVQPITGPIKPITVQPIKPISPVVLPPPQALSQEAMPEEGQATLSEDDVAALQDLIATSDFEPEK